jgi:hypothetical protein
MRQDFPGRAHSQLKGHSRRSGPLKTRELRPECGQGRGEASASHPRLGASRPRSPVTSHRVAHVARPGWLSMGDPAWLRMGDPGWLSLPDLRRPRPSDRRS